MTNVFSETPVPGKNGPPRIGVGIDTGGTYTDAVIYDLENRSVLAHAKAATTRNDLSIGILEALDRLPRRLIAAPSLISLSTTLATNACVENKIGRARLFFFGGNPKVIDSQGADYGLPPASEMFIQDSGTNYSDGVIAEVDWEFFLKDLDKKVAGLDGAGVIEIYSMRNGAVVEKKAKALLRERTGLPVVCGHELVSELGCLERGASTLLNASLFPIIDEFLSAIRKSLARRGIYAPVAIVRSDGNVMGEEQAALRPVETLLCGPAASVMGAVELAGERDCIVIDMGGTTSDIAVIRNGEPLAAENGIGAGKWKTFIRGLHIKTFGLGGDSALHSRDQRLVLESRRVVPLCMAAAHPGVLAQLKRQLDEFPKHTRNLHEGFILVKSVESGSRYTEFEKNFCRVLESGPLLLRPAALAVGRDEYTLDVSRLVNEGVVQMFGFTPTDVMHLRGDFSRYDAEASQMGARFVANSLGVTVEDLCALAYDEVKRKLYLHIVKALLEHESPDCRENGIDIRMEKLVVESFERAKRGRGRGFVEIPFRTSLPLVGIGAPIHVFLPEVAARLGTRAVIPEYAAVANAVGAVVGKVQAESRMEVWANYTQVGIRDYTVIGRSGARTFDSRRDAEAFAASEAVAAARTEAI
ncbi:MAG: hydantoinase/oxoprolinase family protein, partial [Planctomycetes bacterium]|nr:hydantoinase/oxoprolinase family protein [Planctomycetota bacterium]